ncbi:MAG: putative SOS response-associated peptidase YedK [Cognaticolwellia sp.]|jgi:putative SOS response-associated peptidase YedK
MCARTLLITKRVKLHFFVSSLAPEIFSEGLRDSTMSSHNLAPTDDIAVLRLSDQGPELTSMRWGLVTSGQRTAPKQTLRRPLINARQDKLATWRDWTSPFQQRRCLVLTSGWIEWTLETPTQAQAQTTLFAASRPPQPERQAWWFRPKGGGLVAMAGFWNPWDPPSDPGRDSAALITVNASPSLSRWHDRSPVVLSQRDWGAYLNPDTVDPQALLRSPGPGEIEVQPLGADIGSVRNKSAEVLQPKGETILAM